MRVVAHERQSMLRDFVRQLHRVGTHHDRINLVVRSRALFDETEVILGRENFSRHPVDSGGSDDMIPVPLHGKPARNYVTGEPVSPGGVINKLRYGAVAL